MTELFVSKRNWTYNGKQVEIGEIVEPTGSPRDSQLFGDSTHWTTRFYPINGSEPSFCDTDGCNRRFTSDAMLRRHRATVHAPEREPRIRAQLDRLESKIDAEDRGDTIGGHEVVKKVKGPRGEVPYIAIDS